jgi:transposase
MSLWTTKLVRHFVYPHFGVEYCRERIRQLLHELGFRWRRLPIGTCGQREKSRKPL